MALPRPSESKQTTPASALSKILLAVAMAHIKGADENPKLAYRFLSSPTKALSYTDFEQLSFIDHVNQIAKAELLEPYGICYGYHTLSFAYHCMGLDRVFDQQIKNLSVAKKITAEQQEFLEQLEDFQKCNASSPEIGLCVNEQYVLIKGQCVKILNVNEDKRFAGDVKSAAEQAITYAVTHFGSRVGISLQGKERGHIIGLTAKREKDELILETDDPEYFIKVRHGDFSSASADLTKLLAQGYRTNFDHFWSQKKSAPILLLTHEAECNGHEYPTRADREWAQKNQHRFFGSAPTAAASATAKAALTAAAPVAETAVSAFH